MNKILMNVTLLLALLLSYQSKEIYEAITQLSRTFEQAEQQDTTGQAIMDAYDTRIKWSRNQVHNLSELGQKIAANEINLTQNGHYEESFLFDYILNDSETLQMMAKPMKINTDSNKANFDREQTNLSRMIRTNVIVHGIDLTGLFFLDFFGAFDVTDKFNELTENVTGENLEYLSSDTNTESYLLLWEYIELNLLTHMNKVYEQSIKSSFHTRLRIYKGIGNGLNHSKRNFLHCNIIPQNIMLKPVPKNANFYEGFLPIEITPERFYQVKIKGVENIGFGKSCQKSTPGSLPFKGGINSYDHGFDDFALAMIAIDFEMAERNLGYMSYIFAIWSEKKPNSTPEEKNEIKSRIERTSLYKYLEYFWSVTELKDDLIYYIKYFFPDYIKSYDAKFNRVYDDYTIYKNVIKDAEFNVVPELLFESSKMFTSFMLATVNVFFNKHLTNLFNTVEKPKYEKKITDLITEAGEPSSTDYQKKIDKSEYYKHLLIIKKNELLIRILFFHSISDVINTVTKGIYLEIDFYKTLENISVKYEERIADSLEYVGKYEALNNVDGKNNMPAEKKYPMVDDDMKVMMMERMQKEKYLINTRRRLI